ncbi:hypothetical protein JW859_10595 [bacterium]|nr:hypothetical protein [bacterium]
MLLGLSIVSLIACQGAPGNRVAIDPATDTSLSTKHVDLASALNSVDAAGALDDLDADLYARLSTELKQVLIDLYGDDPVARRNRLAAAVPPSDTSRAWAPQCTSTLSGETTLYFRGRHVGDYNMDGLVSVSDITPLGFHFNKNVTVDADGFPAANDDNEWAAVTDGNEDLLVGISDITPIGQNWDSRLLGYRIYLGIAGTDESFSWDTEYQPNPDDAGLPYSLAFSDSREPSQVQLYSYTFTRPALNPGETLWARIVPFDGTIEETPTELPVVEGAHAPQKCQICHVVTDYSFREVANSCQLCHATPPEGGGAWTEAPGMHSMCLSCHTQHVFTIDPPETPCGQCHSTIASAVAAANMPQCLGCHENSHLPNNSPGNAACTTCHTEPPGIPGGNWADAPGSHSNCALCHSAHQFAVSEPNAICENCHADKYGSGHGDGSDECLSCHVSPHLPDDEP